MEKKRLKIVCIIFAFYLVFFNTLTVYAYYAPEILPTLWGDMFPPKNGDLVNSLYNAFGLEKDNSSDLYEVWQGFKGAIADYCSDVGRDAAIAIENVRNLFSDAKKTGKLVIPAEEMPLFRGTMLKACTTGVPRGGEVISITDKTALMSEIQDYITYSGYTLTITMDACSRVYDAAYTYWNEPITCAILGDYLSTNHGNQNAFWIFFYPSSWELLYQPLSLSTWSYQFADGTIPLAYAVYPGGYSNLTAPPTVEMKYTTREGYTKRGIDFGSKEATSYHILRVCNTRIIPDLQNDDTWILTASTSIDVETGEIDKTKDIEIILPASLPSTGTLEEIPDTSLQIGAVSTSMTEDVTETISQIQAIAGTSGEVSDFSVNVVDLFPFCLPFDIYEILSKFCHEPETPVFTLSIPYTFERDENGHFIKDPETGKYTVVCYDFTIDMHIFDGVALVLRSLETVGFVLGLAIITREKFLRG